MKIHRRTRVEKAEDQQFILERLGEQCSAEEIHKALEALRGRPIALSTVTRDITAIDHEYQLGAGIDPVTARGRQLAEITALERECWRGYRESQTEKRTSTTEQIDLPPLRIAKGKPGAAIEEVARRQVKARLKMEKREGASYFLNMIRWCKQERGKILGVYAPIKHEVSGTDGGAQRHDVYVHEERRFLTRAEQQRELVRLAALNAVRGDGEPDPEPALLPPGFQSAN